MKQHHRKAIVAALAAAGLLASNVGYAEANTDTWPTTERISRSGVGGKRAIIQKRTGSKNSVKSKVAIKKQHKTQNQRNHSSVQVLH